jgi:hypothetical protein
VGLEPEEVSSAIGSPGCTPKHVVTDKAAFYPIGYPRLRARCQAHRHWLLQPGDLNESLRAESWLRQAHRSLVPSQQVIDHKRFQRIEQINRADISAAVHRADRFLAKAGDEHSQLPEQDLFGGR